MVLVRRSSPLFDVVTSVGMTLLDVELVTKYDGAPVLKVHGVFMAGLATHESAEPDTLVVRTAFDDRALMLEDAPDTYYITEYYRKYPLVLARLASLNRDALYGLLSASYTLALEKTGRR